MSPLEDSYPTTAVHEYSKIAKVQEKDLKTDFMIKVFKEEMNKSLQKNQGKDKILEEINKSPKEIQESQSRQTSKQRS